MLDSTYEAAVASLRGWSDKVIMECDLRRLCFAIDTAEKVNRDEWRHRYRLAGWKVEDPVYEPETDEEFNEQVRATLRMFSRSRGA